jgi:hypothetical protein
MFIQKKAIRRMLAVFAILTVSCFSVVAHMIKGQTHNGIRHDVLAMEQVKEWVNTHQLLSD